jgi:hypothetical protein
MPEKTYYRPSTPKYEGAPLVVRPEDRQPNTAYRPLIRLGKQATPSDDPVEQRRHKRIVIGAIVVMIFVFLALAYLGT